MQGKTPVAFINGYQYLGNEVSGPSRCLQSRCAPCASVPLLSLGFVAALCEQTELAFGVAYGPVTTAVAVDNGWQVYTGGEFASSLSLSLLSLHSRRCFLMPRSII